MECNGRGGGGGREGEGEAGGGGGGEKNGLEMDKLASDGAPNFKMVSEMKAWATRNTLGLLGFFRL